MKEIDKKHITVKNKKTGYEHFFFIHNKYEIIKELKFNNHKYYKARNKENNNFIIFDISGNACFGGEHFWILDFVTIDNITYLKAQHERCGKIAFYDQDGNVKEVKE